MKKFLAVCLAAVMMLGASACSKEKAKEGDDQAAVKTEKQKVIIGLDDQFPPMGFRDDAGELVGFDIDLAKEACARMGVEPVFQPIDWKAKELELNEKKVDILWNGLTILPERREVMLFTDPYIQNVQIIVTRPDAGIAAKADLAGKAIGVQADSSAINAMEADAETFASFGSLNEYATNILAFADLDIGRVDAVVVDSIVAMYYIAENNANFIVLEENFGDEEYGVAVRLDDTELHANLQEAINSMIVDGVAADISTKWFNTDIMMFTAADIEVIDPDNSDVIDTMNEVTDETAE